MGLAVVASATDKSGGAENGHNFSITVPAVGNGMAMILGAISSAADGPIHIDSCTFDGNAMTLIDLTSFGYISAYSRFGFRYLNPAAGSKTVAMVFAGKTPVDYACKIAAVVYIMSGVNQSTPIRTIKTGLDVSTLSGITCTPGDLIADLCASDQNGVPSSPGTQQVSYLADKLSASGSWGNVASSVKQVSVPSEQVTWGSGFSPSIGYMAIPIVPADTQSMIMFDD